MNQSIAHRTIQCAHYILAHRTTIRAAARHFGVSKSTVHLDITRRLRAIDPALYTQVAALLAFNRQERHLRGGASTRQRYALAKK